MQNYIICINYTYIHTARLILILSKAKYEIENLQKENGTTVISIAHRLSTLKNTDEIFVFDKGKIIERGKFDDLKDRPGIFQDMYLGKLK